LNKKLFFDFKAVAIVTAFFRQHLNTAKNIFELL